MAPTKLLLCQPISSATGAGTYRGAPFGPPADWILIRFSEARQSTTTDHLLLSICRVEVVVSDLAFNEIARPEVAVSPVEKFREFLERGGNG